MNLPEKYFVIDFENTGGSINKGHKVTGVGVVVVEKINDEYKITKRFTTLVNPERSISPFVEKLVGIKSSEVNSDKYPKIEPVFDKLLNMFGNDKIFVAHGIGVDFKMFNYLYEQKFGNELKCLGLDTHKLAKKLLGCSKNSIGNLFNRYNFTNSRHHQPDFDAEVASCILIESLNKIDNENLDINNFIINLPKIKDKKKKDKKNKNKLKSKFVQQKNVCA